MSNREALESALPHLATGPEHAALVESARTLADYCDSSSVFDDKAWREYRLALKALMDATGGAAGDGDSFLDELRASMGDPEDARA